MEDLLYKVILGWPSAVLGLFFLAVGSALRRVSLSIFGAIAATGFCLFVSMYVIPYTLLLLLVIASNWASVIYLSKGRRRLAVALISPLAIESLAFGYVVYAQ